jgi:hypothetical protein
MSDVIELELETKTIRIAGTDYIISVPYGDSIDQFNKKVNEDEGNTGEFGLIREFFEGLGLPEEALKQLQLPHYKKIMAGLMPKND